jgi:Zn-dependent protease
MLGLNRQGTMTRKATSVLGRPKRAAPRQRRVAPNRRHMEIRRRLNATARQMQATDYVGQASRRYRRTAAILPLVMVNSSFSLFDFGCWLVVFLISLSTHEAAHAFTAQRLGDVTGYLGGQVTLNPVPHIRREPWGMLIIPILSYISSGWMIGWASAPYNSAWAERYPKRAAVMAMAGPAANFAIALLSWCGLKMGLLAGTFVPGGGWRFSDAVVSVEPGIWAAIASLLSIAFSLNVLLGVFNLLPLPPLDGSALPLFFLHGEIARSYQRFSRSAAPAMLGIFVAWQFFPRIYRPLYAWLESTLRG